MKQILKKIKEKCVIGMAGSVWVAGIFIAGSDGPYMPWLNGIGIGLFFCASFLLGRYFHPLNVKSTSVAGKKFYEKPDAVNRRPDGKKRSGHIRYALEI